MKDTDKRAPTNVTNKASTTQVQVQDMFCGSEDMAPSSFGDAVIYKKKEWPAQVNRQETYPCILRGLSCLQK